MKIDIADVAISRATESIIRDLVPAVQAFSFQPYGAAATLTVTQPEDAGPPIAA